MKIEEKSKIEVCFLLKTIINNEILIEIYKKRLFYYFYYSNVSLYKEYMRIMDKSTNYISVNSLYSLLNEKNSFIIDKDKLKNLIFRFSFQFENDINLFNLYSKIDSINYDEFCYMISPNIY